MYITIVIISNISAALVFPVPDMELNTTMLNADIGSEKSNTMRGITVSSISVFWSIGAMIDIQNSGEINVIAIMKTIIPRFNKHIFFTRGITPFIFPAPIVLPTSVLAVVANAFIGMK